MTLLSLSLKTNSVQSLNEAIFPVSACWNIWQFFHQTKLVGVLGFPTLSWCGKSASLILISRPQLADLSGQSYWHPQGYRVMSFPLFEKCGTWRASPSYISFLDTISPLLHCGKYIIRWTWHNRSNGECMCTWEIRTTLPMVSLV